MKNIREKWEIFVALSLKFSLSFFVASSSFLMQVYEDSPSNPPLVLYPIYQQTIPINSTWKIPKESTRKSALNLHADSRPTDNPNFLQDSPPPSIHHHRMFPAESTWFWLLSPQPFMNQILLRKSSPFPECDAVYYNGVPYLVSHFGVCCGPAMTVLTLTVHSSTLGRARIMFNTPICWKTPGEQHGTREILSCRYVSNSKKHYKTPPWKGQPVLPFLSESAAGTNITSHQVIIILQMILRCCICYVFNASVQLPCIQ